jgi:FlaA1/EpsC-like NDP-sugar epimerase
VSDATANKKYIYIRWCLLRLGLVLFDILAVNAAYYLALVVRFYVNFEFNVWAIKYVPAFFDFAPYYTVCALIVFGFFGLYKSLWKYAGLSDMNRIIGACAITCVIHIVGTLVFVMRMPITYYAFGAAFQFVFLAISRFSYRLLVIEWGNFFKRRKHDTVKVLVVGMGESSRTVIKHLERDHDSMAKPVCMIDISNTEFRGTMAGVPVIGGVEKIPEAIRKYRVDRILIADTIVPQKIRNAVKTTCRQLDIPVQDFSGYFQSTPSRIPLRSVLEYVDGPVVIEVDGNKTRYADASQAEAGIAEKYIVAAIYAQNDIPCIRLNRDVLRPNDIQADWVRDYQEETGEDISFF